MAQVVYSRNALSNLETLHQFLAEKNQGAAQRAIAAILAKLAFLSRFPLLGAADPERPGLRQLFISFGSAGYVARYRVEGLVVVVLAIRHMREAGYTDET